jgi:hypothetical protein
MARTAAFRLPDQVASINQSAAHRPPGKACVFGSLSAAIKRRSDQSA